jgi:hypothetical protein
MSQWNPYQEPVNYIVLEGKKSPGLADVAGAGTPRNWEERQGYGLSGATLWFTGLGLANFTVTIKLYSVADWDAWHAWKPVVKRVPFGRIPKALDIRHPLLDELEIKSVVVTNVHQPKQVEDGVWAIEIEFKQYRRFKLHLMKPEGSKTKESDDPWDKKIEEKAKQVEALAAERARLLGG